MEESQFSLPLQIQRLMVAVRELGEQLASSQEACESATARAAQASAAHKEEMQAVNKTNAALKAAVESSAASLDAASAETKRLQKSLSERTADLERVRDKLRTRTAACIRHQSYAVQLSLPIVTIGCRNM
jgi:chromosome segregation ATPase